jgi:hypothetical protein
VNARLGIIVAPVNIRGPFLSSKIMQNSVFYLNQTAKEGLYQYIADGTVCTNSWFRDLNNPDDITNVEHFVETRPDNASHDIAATVSRHTDVPSILIKMMATIQKRMSVKMRMKMIRRVVKMFSRSLFNLLTYLKKN